MASPHPSEVRARLLDPSRDEVDFASEWRPLAIVDLDRCSPDMRVAALPPFPIVGIGNCNHPFAVQLDAVIEPPIDIEQLIRQVEHAPHAATVIVQLLRVTEGMPIERALTIESFAYGVLQASAEYAAWLANVRPASPTRPGNVRVERSDSVLTVVLDRAQARNAISRDIRDQLFDAFLVAASDPSIRSVQLRAVGEVFSAGGDLTEFGTTMDAATAHLIRSRTLPAVALARRADILDVHIQGPCVGAGLEMAAFAARVTAAPRAWFQLPELGMGLLPGAGGCISIPRRIGRQRAALMMLSGQRIDVETALAWGLIDAIETQAAVE